MRLAHATPSPHDVPPAPDVPRPRRTSRSWPGDDLHLTAHHVGTAESLLRRLTLTPVDGAPDAGRTPLTLVVAAHVVTGCVAGFDLSPSGDGGAGARALALVGVDKSRLAGDAGCRERWTVACRPRRVLTDHATDWRGPSFRAAVDALGASHVMGAHPGTSHQDGDEVVRRLLVLLAQDRFAGHRRAAELAVDRATGLPVDGITLARRLIVRRICDDHHVRSLRRLGGLSPIGTWRRLAG